MRQRRLPRLRERAIDAALDVVPGDFLEKVAAATVPLARHSGRTRAGTAALRSALRALAQPPRRRTRARPAMSLDEVAAVAGATTEEVERWARDGLLGPEPEDGLAWPESAADRAALIAYAKRRGATEEELVDAARRGRLPLILLERVLVRDSEWTGREVAERAGLPIDEAVRFWRALGFPADDIDSPVFGRQDLEALRVVGALRSIFTIDDLTEAASVTGRALSEISAALTELFRRRLVAPFVERGGEDLEVSLRLAAMSELLLSPIGPLLEVALRHHLEAAAGSEAALSIEATAGPLRGERELSVGFADLVDFTSRAEELTALEVGQMAALMLRHAEDAFAGRGARIVKSIGDAVMFTAPDPISACAAAADLLTVVEEDPALPPARAGVAHGPVIRAYADYFGRTVNVASRLCDVAPAGSVLAQQPSAVDRSAWEAAGLATAPRGELRLKGIAEPVPVIEVTRTAPATGRAATRHARSDA